MNSPGRTTFTLHLCKADRLAENILPAICSPLIHHFCHGRRGSYRVDTSNLAKHIADVGGSIVTVTCNKLFFFCHFVFTLVFIVFNIRFTDLRILNR